MSAKKTVCFFSHVSREQLQREHYSIQDINILRELGFSVIVTNCFTAIPWGCDLYFSWWASGSILPLIKARLSKKPIIVVAGGQEAMLNQDSISGTPLGYLVTPWYKKLAIRICLRYSTIILVVSNYMVEDVRRLGAANPIVVHNCVDTKNFNLSTFPRRFVTTIFKSDENVVRIKRGEIFIHSIPIVLREFPEQEFIVIGEKGNASQRLQKLILELGIKKNIEFIGRIDNSEILRWLQRSKAYVQISDTETFGVAIAEAMSCGTPVVVSRRGAIQEVVGNCGVYVDHNDPKSVAGAIINLLMKKEEERCELGFKARTRIVKHFSYEQRKKTIQQIIKKLTNQPNNHHLKAGFKRRRPEAALRSNKQMEI